MCTIILTRVLTSSIRPSIQIQIMTTAKVEEKEKKNLNDFSL